MPATFAVINRIAQPRATGLGAGHARELLFRVWRLAALRVSHARCLRDLKADGHWRARIWYVAIVLHLFDVCVVLRRMGHLWSGVAVVADPHLRSRPLSRGDAARSRTILATVWGSSG